MTTYPNARDAFLSRAALAPRTQSIYATAIEHFLDYAREHGVPPLPRLGESASDAGVLEQFAIWLVNKCEPVQAASTARTYAAGVARWFRWMDDYGLLPTAFPLSKARRMLSETMKKYSGLRTNGEKVKEPPEHIEDTLAYFDSLECPDRLKSPAARSRWLIENMRNRALMRVLAETGGRVSEVLALQVADFPPRAFEAVKSGEVWRAAVIGKNKKEYTLRFLKSLPHIQRYLMARNADGTAAAKALFVRHTPKNRGARLTPNGVWRIVQKAAEGVGIGGVRVHDFRHWCATELVAMGHSMAFVAEYLGHGSVAVTEKFYAHIDQEQVDDLTRELL